MPARLAQDARLSIVPVAGTAAPRTAAQGPARPPCSFLPDAVLLAGYDPCTSAAWAGAAPAAWVAPWEQLDLWAATETLIEEDGGDRPAFLADGFSVRLLRGPGTPALIEDFCARHHYLADGGMNGTPFALVDPDGHIVGIANFAPPQNRRTGPGMQRPHRDDARLSAGELAHLRVGEDDVIDCVRFCLAEATPSGVVLGTGAESFLYAGALRYFAERNRALWRALRKGELGLPLDGGERVLLEEGVPFIKVVRSFADRALGHRGVIYAAVGAWHLGMTRRERTWVGARSGAAIGRRALAKLRTEGSGHVHMCLRAVWEGSHGTAVAADPATGERLLEEDLEWIRSAVPDGLTALRRQAALKRAWRDHVREVQARFGGRRLVWSLQADEACLVRRTNEPKHRYASFMGRPGVAYQLARRCRYLAKTLAAAEATQCRWPRGLGYNFPRRPQALGRPPYPDA